MAEARHGQAWDHTASLMALLANCHRDPNKRSEPFTPQDFNPTEHAHDDDEFIPLTIDQYIALRTGKTPTPPEPSPAETSL